MIAKGTLVWVEFNEETMVERDKEKLDKHGPLWLVRQVSVSGDRLKCESMKDQAIHTWYNIEVKLK